MMKSASRRTLGAQVNEFPVPQKKRLCRILFRHNLNIAKEQYFLEAVIEAEGEVAGVEVDTAAFLCSAVLGRVVGAFIS